MKIVPVLFLLVCQCAAVTKWPFNNDKSSVTGGTQIKAKIGSQNYAVAVNLTLSNDCYGLSIPSNKANSNGFNTASSATFTKTANYPNSGNAVGVTGTDDFTVATPIGPSTSKQLTFNVVDSGTCSTERTMSLAHTMIDGHNKKRPNDFIDSILKDEKEKIAVLIYDKVPDDSSNDPSSGTISFGKRPGVCKSWHSVSDIDANNGKTWNFKIDKLVSGNYVANNPTQYAQFSLNGPGFRIPNSHFNKLRTALGVDNNNAVTCGEATQNITFSINGFNILIIPDDYLLGKDHGPKGNCAFYGFAGSDNDVFELPVQILSRYCLLFDYGKYEVGVADRSDYKVHTHYNSAGNPNNSFILNVWILISLVCFVFKQ